jgi:hypothetical protein
VAVIVYLDVCSLKRPFDDQRSSWIQVETTAIAALVERAEQGAIRLVRSPARRQLFAGLTLNGALGEIRARDGDRPTE